MASQYALNAMFLIATGLMILTFFYKLLAFHTFWGKKETLSRQDVIEHDHTFY